MDSQTIQHMRVTYRHWHQMKCSRVSQKERLCIYFGLSFKINLQDVFVFIVNQMQSLINLIAEKRNGKK